MYFKTVPASIVVITDLQMADGTDPVHDGQAQAQGIGRLVAFLESLKQLRGGYLWDITRIANGKRKDGGCA